MATGKTLIGWYDAGLNRFVKNDLTTSTITVCTDLSLSVGDYKAVTATATKSGYSPLYVCGYKVDETPVLASSMNTGSGGSSIMSVQYICNVVCVYLSGTTITVTVRGVGSSSSSYSNECSVTIKVIILWVKN